ncbi:MAG: DUF3786 domain-containing protein [Deltaproteobacteria bacterium]|nr:DUF3786 domain-containing protein [Deltaproteobacteria bacterium]
MALSVVDLYKKILPQTNCGDCNYPTCIAFASMVVSEKHPLKNCPHLVQDVLDRCEIELEEQYAEGKWLKKDPAKDALIWAKERAASMKISDMPARIGGEILIHEGSEALLLPYFNDKIIITDSTIMNKDLVELNQWEQVFVYNHMSQGGSVYPTGNWKGLVEFPNTISKQKSMKAHVEVPLIDRFLGKVDELKERALKIGGIDRTDKIATCSAAFFFQPMPKTPVMLIFWDESIDDGFDADIKLQFDETITEHLDIESMMFLSERLRQLLCVV